MAIVLRPPLPPPLSHDGIEFVAAPVDLATESTRSGESLSADVLASIALSLWLQLPGDHAADGTVDPEAVCSGTWAAGARIESVSRWPQ